MLSRLAALLILAAGAAAPAAAQDILGPDAAACRPGSGRDAVLLTVDGVILSARAASEKLPASTTRRKTCISPARLSMPRPICEIASQIMWLSG